MPINVFAPVQLFKSPNQVASPMVIGGDVFLYRDAANVLGMHNDVNPQSLYIYNTFTDLSNFERIQLYWTGNAFTIQTNGGGTGNPLRPIDFWIGPTQAFRFTTAADFIPQLDNVRSIGDATHRLVSIFSVSYTGTVTNDLAPAGKIGEYITSVVATGASVALTTNTPANVTSISLTAGDWDVDGAVDFTLGATTSVTRLQGGVSSVTATIGGQDSYFQDERAASVPGSTVDPVFDVPTVRFSLSATTTIYLVAQATFTVSTAKAYGTIRARRMR